MNPMNQEITTLAWTGLHMTPWKLIGLAGATLFALRWLVQFAATRSAGEPVIPRAFWWMSLTGSAMTLSYFLFSSKQDAVGALQNLFPAFTAAYSLWLGMRRPAGRGGAIEGSGVSQPRDRCERRDHGDDARHQPHGEAAAAGRERDQEFRQRVGGQCRQHGRDRRVRADAP